MTVREIGDVVLSEHENSALQVLLLFSREEVRSSADLYEHFGVGVFDLVFGARITLGEFIAYLERRGEITSSKSGYVLSDKGFETLQRLRRRAPGEHGERQCPQSNN